MVGGDNTVRRWHDELTFERNAGRTSNPLAGVAAGFCPGCGALADIDDQGRCKACGEHVTGGEYDWVLTREERSQG
jgi:hypothetical protein